MRGRARQRIRFWFIIVRKGERRNLPWRGKIVEISMIRSRWIRSYDTGT